MLIQKLLEQVIPGLGFEFVDVETTSNRTIQVFIDKSGGVTIDDCEKVSSHLSKLFLVENIDYNRLEVSSPGLERPLKKLDDFIKFIGQTVKIKTRELINGQKVFLGKIIEVEGHNIKLELDKALLFTINYADILKSRLVFVYKNNLKPIKKK